MKWLVCGVLQEWNSLQEHMCHMFGSRGKAGYYRRCCMLSDVSGPVCSPYFILQVRGHVIMLFALSKA